MNKPMMRDLAAKIDAHLKRFEVDKDGVNASRDGTSTGLRPYYCAGAGYCGGPRIGVRYITYQGTSTLTREQAVRYLAWLDDGNVGRHYEVLRG